jgi:hypothetical protein
MKYGFVIAGLALLLVGCNPKDGCRSHADEASCVADKACQWKAEKNKCKAAKNAPAPSEQAAPPTAAAPSAAPGANYSLPSTETQPQPTYPEGE